MSIQSCYLCVPDRPVAMGAQGGRISPAKMFAHLEKCLGHSLKLLNIV